MTRIFSGIQPTGRLHLGNYLGALKQWLELQKKYPCIFCIVDYHAITVKYRPNELQKLILDTAIEYLALGLNPQKSIIFVQSQVPEHTELAWILNTLTLVSQLERMTQYKEKKIQHAQNINASLLTYPVLMAADILLYKANLVPVGEDQVQHVELARTIARRFNHSFGQVFPEPKTKITAGARIMSLNEPNKKMSKSLGAKSYIALADSPKVIKNKLASAVTDVGPESKKLMSPGVKNLFLLLKEFDSKGATYKKFEKEYQTKTIRYQKLKEELAVIISDYFADFRKKREELARNPAQIKKILDKGAAKAKPLAQKTLKEIKEKMGLI